MTDKSTSELTQTNTAPSGIWSSAIPVLILMLVGLLAIFYETVWSMVSIWYRSETFAHGFIILPITLWLIWEKRKVLSTLHPVPEYRVLVLLSGAGFLWLLGYLVSALVIQQLALVSLIIFSIWVVLGNRITWLISFPLAYLFFAVPMGEDLVPHLMEVTATATVFLIKMTGVPVFREGLYFSLPSGNWSVVEACSGVRYLIASVTLGALYAYLTYSAVSKRVIFIIVSAIVPIIANTLRAYMIVMLGHMSDMKIATGVDHLIYGWLFFGLVMLILFAIGARWRDDSKSFVDGTEGEGHISNQKPFSSRSNLLASVAILSAVSVWPLLGYAMTHRSVDYSTATVTLPSALGEWRGDNDPVSDWQPRFLGTTHSTLISYRLGDNAVDLSVGVYGKQEEGKELINSKNALMGIDEDPAWRISEHKKINIEHSGSTLPVDQYLIKGKDHSYQVLSWYRIGDYHTSSRYQGKLLEAYYRLTFGRQDSARVVMVIPHNPDMTQLQLPDQKFFDLLIPALGKELDLFASTPLANRKEQ
ncbi:exosortase A [Sedimenticola selenatireducens]|uniref:Exosortase A n=1 Tax=Sedimenticola selenatireducens TaxID=191960 RepID=A0A557S865_9GAMM|nr:exosortase A [Sedimenticola selenatireducens]TVO73574.1 exosortase A [Sedimenticola selenatireducens]TVT63514.1 MAG: exosortase A [Sedimenticola selenatireducens]